MNGRRRMEMIYESPKIELILVSSEDIISTSPTIELPWLPVEDEIFGLKNASTKVLAFRQDDIHITN